MKTYVYILILLATCMFASSGCRANRNLSENSTRNSEFTTTDNSSSSKESTSSTAASNKTHKESTKESTSTTASDQEKSVSQNEYEEENKRKVEYYTDGTIKSIEETNKRRGQTNQTDERGRSLHASNMSDNSTEESETKLESETSETENTQTNIELSGHENEDINKKEDTSTDSRWIQGWEWLAICIPIVVLLGVIYFVRNGK